MPVDRNWRFRHTSGLLLIVVAIVLIGWNVRGPNRVVGWAFVMLLMLLFVLLAGHGVTGLGRGAFIDERNKMSLARLQLVLWSVVVLSGFLVIALNNIAKESPNPLSIAIPAEIWAILGISTTSLVGSPLILSNKKHKPPNREEQIRTFSSMEAQGVDVDGITPQGQVLVNAEPSAAGWGDLFKGEETGNAAQLDMGKVQMFFFTLILVLAYGVAVGALLRSDRVLTALPALDPGIVALLGISHAGYLTNKAVPHSASPAS